MRWAVRPPCSLPRQGHNKIIVLNQDLKTNIIQFRWSLSISNLQCAAKSGHSPCFQTTNTFSNYRSAQFNPRNQTAQTIHEESTVRTVEGLYCKRPIRCLASFEILTPPPHHRPASVYPPAFGAEGGHTCWVERGWGVNSSEDARHCSGVCTQYM